MVGAETRTPSSSCSSIKVARAMYPTSKGPWETPLTTQAQREIDSPSNIIPSTLSKPGNPSSPSSTDPSIISKLSNTSDHSNITSSINLNTLSDSSNPSSNPSNIISNCNINFSVSLSISTSTNTNVIKDPSKATNNSIIIILSARRTPENSIRSVRIQRPVSPGQKEDEKIFDPRREEGEYGERGSGGIEEEEKRAGRGGAE